MSNPLSMFRKHQYIFLVVFGVMLMVAFIVLPPLDDYLRQQPGPGSGGDPVVVTWRGGKLKETELERLRLMHRVAVSYLFAVVSETQRREGTPRGVRRDQIGRVVDPGIPSTMSDENLVHTHLLASKGEAMGMVVSDEAIAEFLEQLSDDTIRTHEMGAIFKESLGGQFSLQQLLNQLRVELMAQRVRSMAEAGLYVAPYGTVQPVQAWDYFKRLNRRVSIEAVAFDVRDYVDQVAAPTEQQLKALYEEGKNRFSFPESPEPGFQQRRKAAFQFVRVDFDKFLEEEKAKVTITDEAIEKHYEENKDVRYRALDLPAAGDGNDADLDGDSTATDTTQGDAADKDTAKKPADPDPAPVPPADDPAPQPPADKTPDEKAPASAAPADEKPVDEKPADKKPVDEKPVDDAPAPAAAADDAAAEAPEPAPPADKPPAEPKPATTPPAEPAPDAPAESPGEARRMPAKAEYFVTTQGQQNEPPAAAPETPSVPPVATDAPPTPPAADDSQAEAATTDAKAAPQAGTPAKETIGDETVTAPAADATPAAAPATPAASSATKTGDETAPAATPDAATPDAEAPGATPPATSEPPKVRPLDDQLREEIREELIEIEARKPAQERVDKALSELRSQVTKLGRAKRSALRETQSKDDDAEPAGPVDVTELAAQHGLTVGQIPLVDAIEINGSADGEQPGYELGEAFNMQYTSWPPTRENFTDLAFAEGVRRYSPTTISGSESGIQFLYWKTDGEEPYVPDFAEARPEVEAAWKLIEARKVAQKEAKSLQEELNQSKKSLAEAFAEDSERTVIQPPDFSWMSTGFNPGGGGAPVLSDIEGIENPGQDLMKEIFSLDVGEVGVSLDMAQAKVYVVRVASDSPEEEVLKQLFLASGDSQEVQYIAYVESISLLRDWYSNLETEMGLKWQRDPIDAT